MVVTFFIITYFFFRIIKEIKPFTITTLNIKTLIHKTPYLKGAISRPMIYYSAAAPYI